MIGIIVVGHGHIASEMCLAVEHVLGKQPLLAAVDVTDSNNPELLNRQLRELIDATDNGQGVLILADMFGGTPCNVAVSLMGHANAEVISGANLPALIKATSLRHQTDDLIELAKTVVVSGQQYICRASDFMGENTDG